MLRSRIVVPRRFANGNVTYGTGLIVRFGWRNTASAAASAGLLAAAGGVINVT